MLATLGDTCYVDDQHVCNADYEGWEDARERAALCKIRGRDMARRAQSLTCIDYELRFGTLMKWIALSAP
jgi:hypothetical protein